MILNTLGGAFFLIFGVNWVEPIGEDEAIQFKKDLVEALDGASRVEIVEHSLD